MSDTAPMSQEDLAKSLVVDDQPAPAEQDQNETVAADEGQDTVAAAADDTPPKAAAEKDEKPREGTPDKVLQKLQQDQAAAQRKLDALLEKMDDGQRLSDKEKQEVGKAKRKLDAIREAMQTGFDIVDPDHATSLAESVIEQDDEVQAIKSRLAVAEQKLAASEQENTWTEHSKAYQGVDVKSVWAKAFDDTVKSLGDGPQTVRAASLLFHERCKAAAASVQARKPGGNKSATNPAPGGQVAARGSASPASSLTPEQEYKQLAMGLVKDD